MWYNIAILIKKGQVKMEAINSWVLEINNVVWGPPLIFLILAVGIILTVRMGGLQIRRLPLAFRFMVKNEEDGTGEVSSFGALCTALSATIGTGNIVGVATAIYTGGPGALFWMVIAAFFGMATKYAEGLLAVKYRTVDERGHVLGGPFYYIEKGMGEKWKWLAKMFALFGASAAIFGVGTFTQVSGITDAVQDFFDPGNIHTIQILGRDYSLSIIIAGAIVSIATALVLIGGVKRITSVTEIVVPFMAILYVGFCIVLLVLNFRNIPAAFEMIVKGAFDPAAVTGGMVGSIMVAAQKGIARGIFSNESGLGSAPIAAAAARTKDPVRQGLVCMMGTFITVIICIMTGLAIVTTGAWQVPGLEGVGITTYAFQQAMPFAPRVASFVLMLSLVFFAFTTILGWNYYSERCFEYLIGGRMRSILAFRWVYILAVFVGPYMTVSLVWNISDVFNALMAFPNLVGLLALNGVIVRETKQYFQKPAIEKKGRFHKMDV